MKVVGSVEEVALLKAQGSLGEIQGLCSSLLSIWVGMIVPTLVSAGVEAIQEQPLESVDAGFLALVAEIEQHAGMLERAMITPFEEGRGRRKTKKVRSRKI